MGIMECIKDFPIAAKNGSSHNLCSLTAASHSSRFVANAFNKVTIFAVIFMSMSLWQIQVKDCSLYLVALSYSYLLSETKT